MRIPRKLKKKLKKSGSYDNFKQKHLITLDEMIAKIDDCGLLCNCCYYESECSKGVMSSPNGPIFPPCSNGDCFDEELIREEYINLIKGENNG